MAKYTISLHDYIRNELIRKGHSEIYENDRLVIDGFVTTLLNHSNQEIIEDMLTSIFGYFRLKNLVYDKEFKLAFLFRFYYHEIKFQTIELFKLKLMSFLTERRRYIEYVYENFEDIAGGSTSQSGNKKQQMASKNRSAMTTTPQDEINLDIEDNELPYADNNSIGILQNETVNDDKSTTKKYDVDTIMKSSLIFDTMFEQMEEKLFMMIF